MKKRLNLIRVCVRYYSNYSYTVVLARRVIHNGGNKYIPVDELFKREFHRVHDGKGHFEFSAETRTIVPGLIYGENDFPLHLVRQAMYEYSKIEYPNLQPKLALRAPSLYHPPLAKQPAVMIYCSPWRYSTLFV